MKEARLCFFCSAPMQLLTHEHGFDTYGCPRGCDYHCYEEESTSDRQGDNCKVTEERCGNR